MNFKDSLKRKDFNDFHDFKRLSGFSIWISMDLHHKILKDFMDL